MTSPAADRRRTFLRGLVVASLVGVFLATTGAFGSANAPYVQRLAYWVMMMILGGLWGLYRRPFERFAGLRYLHRRQDPRRARRMPRPPPNQAATIPLPRSARGRSSLRAGG